MVGSFMQPASILGKYRDREKIHRSGCVVWVFVVNWIDFPWPRKIHYRKTEAKILDVFGISIGPVIGFH